MAWEEKRNQNQIKIRRKTKGGLDRPFSGSLLLLYHVLWPGNISASEIE